jgi:hypothetical protein
MVGRSPEYLGRKVGAREVKLAVIALLVHPLMILGPTGLFAATSWGTKAEFNHGAHGFSEIVYQFTSSSANNGSGFEGLGDTWGFNDNLSPAPESRPLQANILAKSGKAVETAGDIDVVLLDKTGTITMGNRHATDFLPVGKYNVQQLGRLAAIASIADELLRARLSSSSISIAAVRRSM